MLWHHLQRSLWGGFDRPTSLQALLSEKARAGGRRRRGGGGGGRWRPWERGDAEQSRNSWTALLSPNKNGAGSGRAVVMPHSQGTDLAFLGSPSDPLKDALSQIAFDSRAAGSVFVFSCFFLPCWECVSFISFSQINVYLSNWTGVLVFHSLVPHFFCRPEKMSFFFCYPAQTQNAGSTYIMHRNVGNRLWQWSQSYTVAFVPFEHHCALPLDWLSFCT